MKYSLEFLCWVNRCLYPEDLIKDLVKEGMDELEAKLMIGSKTKLNILDIYQDYCLNDDSIRYSVESFLESMERKWNAPSKTPKNFI